MFSKLIICAWHCCFVGSNTSQLLLVWVPQENLSWYCDLNIFLYKVTPGIKCWLYEYSDFFVPKCADVEL